MKKIILSIIFTSALFFSCKEDGCIECEKQLPNSTTTSEICPEGSDVRVFTEIIGISKDSLVRNITVDAYSQTLISTGYTCK